MRAAPGVDTLTDRVSVVVQERPVIPLSSWLIDTIGGAARSGRRTVQILTSQDARITQPLRSTMIRTDTMWVVQDPAGGYYDGLSGIQLTWDGAAFVPAATERAATLASAFTATEPGPSRQLHVDLRIVQSASTRLVLGGSIEILARALAGARPSSWGSSEPALDQWDRSRLTELCRRRAPSPTRLVFVGHEDAERAQRPFIGTLLVERVPSGVKETVAFAAAYEPDEAAPVDVLTGLADELAQAGALVTMVVRRAWGRPDLTFLPVRTDEPSPVGMAIGPRVAAEIGLHRASSAPAHSRQIGPSSSPGFWYCLRDQGDAARWQQFGELMAHLHPSTA
ncbi:DUF6177 family protein [Spirillospora sp. CA-255316]